MFTGVVVQSFAYVYQTPGGASLTREQIRECTIEPHLTAGSFKRVWAEVDKDRTGYIRRRDFTRFFSKLNGVFEVRLYPIEFSIANLLRDTVPDPNTPAKRVETGAHYAVDVRKLRHRIAQIDYSKVRERRRQYVRLFNEAKLSEEPGRGISFTSMLLMLSHYKLIDDEKALQVDDLLIRRAKMERVEDLVNLDRVRGLLRTIYWRRKFVQSRATSLVLGRESEGIPAIVLDPTSTPPDDQLQATMYDKSEGSGVQVDPLIRVQTPERTGPSASPQTSPLSSPGKAPSESGSPEANLSTSTRGTVFAHANNSTTSYSSALSAPDLGRRTSLDSRTSSELTVRQGYVSEVDSTDSRESFYESEGEDEVMTGLATSAWASMMQDAVDEEGDSDDE